MGRLVRHRRFFATPNCVLSTIEIVQDDIAQHGVFLHAENKDNVRKLNRDKKDAAAWKRVQVNKGGITVKLKVGKKKKNLSRNNSPRILMRTPKRLGQQLGGA